MDRTATGAIIQRERWIIGGCLAAMTVVAWLYLFHTRTAMPGMNTSGMDMSSIASMAMPEMYNWTPTAVFLLFVMWAVMMVAMMMPSAAPMVLAFLSLNQSRSAAKRPLVPVGIFVTGYLIGWTAFSLIAALAQWRLHEAALLSAAMAATSPVLSGSLLIAAGIFQWTPFKRACLKNCRSPLSFIMSEWREGTWGALVMGLRHGAYCVGCCWALMALLFVAGVMNLAWVAAIALFVMAEKILTKEELLSRASGVALLTAGIALVARVL
jgi:predicted metal-binding membrane protein